MILKSIPQPWTRWEIIIFGMIVLLAAYLRLSQPGIVEFKRDEAALSQLALNAARGRDFPLLGIGSSVGFPNAPLNVYLLATPYTLSSSPVLATQFIGLLNVLAVAFTYLLARRYAGRTAAITAGLLLAVSPWSIIFSRKIWAQNMLPLFIVLTVYTGIRGFIEGRRDGQWLHLPLLVFTGQIHYAAFVMIPVSGWLLWRGRKNVQRAFAFSILIAALLTTPYAVGLARASVDLSRESLASGLAEENRELTLTIEALRSAGVIIAGTEIHALAGTTAYQSYRAQLPDFWPLFTLIALTTVAGSLWLIVRSLNRRDARTSVDFVLLLWLIVPIASFSFTWTPFYIHYLIPLLPAAYLVIGFALGDLQRALANYKASRALLFAVGGMAALIVVLQLWAWITLLNFVDRRYTPDGFGTPLHYLMPVREAIFAQGPSHVIGIFPGSHPEYDEQPAIWRTLLDDLPDVRFESPGTTVYPPADTLLLTLADCTASDSYRLRHEAEGCYQIGSRQLDALEIDAYTTVPEVVQFDNGVEVMAYRWQNTGCLELLWQITQPGTRATSFATHFFDDEGNRTAVADGPAWHASFWRPGDRVVSAYCIAADMPVQRVDIGMYAFQDGSITGISRVDVTGQPTESMASLPLTP